MITVIVKMNNKGKLNSRICPSKDYFYFTINDNNEQSLDLNQTKEVSVNGDVINLEIRLKYFGINKEYIVRYSSNIKNRKANEIIVKYAANNINGLEVYYNNERMKRAYLEEKMLLS